MTAAHDVPAAPSGSGTSGSPWPIMPAAIEGAPHVVAAVDAPAGSGTSGIVAPVR